MNYLVVVNIFQAFILNRFSNIFANLVCLISFIDCYSDVTILKFFAKLHVQFD